MARSKTIRLNLKGYDPDGPAFSGGGGFHIPEDVYKMRCNECEHTRSKSSDNPMLALNFTGTAGKGKGKMFYIYCPTESTGEGHVQKLGHTLEALGVEVTDDLSFNLADVEEVEVWGIIRDDEYNGQQRSKLESIYATEEEAREAFEGKPSEDEDTGSRRSSRRGNGKKKAVKFSEDEVKEMEEEELEDLNEKHELEIDFAKFKTLSRKKNAVIEALSEKDMIS